MSDELLNEILDELNEAALIAFNAKRKLQGVVGNVGKKSDDVNVDELKTAIGCIDTAINELRRAKNWI